MPNFTLINGLKKWCSLALTKVGQFLYSWSLHKLKWWWWPARAPATRPPFLLLEAKVWLKTINDWITKKCPPLINALIWTTDDFAFVASGKPWRALKKPKVTCGLTSAQFRLIDSKTWWTVPPAGLSPKQKATNHDGVGAGGVTEAALKLLNFPAICVSTKHSHLVNAMESNGGYLGSGQGSAGSKKLKRRSGAEWSQEPAALWTRHITHDTRLTHLSHAPSTLLQNYLFN